MFQDKIEGKLYDRMRKLCWLENWLIKDLSTGKCQYH